MYTKRAMYSGVIGIAILAMVGYIFFSHTSTGRIAGLYLVGGWSAPSEQRSVCKQESIERVAELFTQPLNMNEEAKQGLREYWHYSYYRECLYHAGYTFMGKPLARSTLTASDTKQLRYNNPLGGVSMIVPTDTTLGTSNELDVMFDYRLLRSQLLIGTGTVLFDTYTEHQFIRTFGDLPQYLDHFPASQSAFVLNESRTTATGIPFLYVEDENGMCGALVVTPEARILHIYSACTHREQVLNIADTILFEEEVASVH